MSAGIAIIGLYNWGLLGNGLLWSMLLIMLVTLCFGIKKGLLWTLAIGCYAVFIGANFIYGSLTTEVDPEIYVTSFSGWATAIFGSVLPLVVAVIIIGTLYETARLTLIKLNKQRLEITLLAERDALTGLYNARIFYELIEQVIERSRRHNSWVYLVNMDLDGFKQINDTFGHHAGDQILKSVAKQLVKATRTVDTLCRVGGDEFLVLIEYPERHSQSEMEELMRRIQEAIEEPLNYDNTTLSISTSIGYVEFNAEQNPELSNIDELLKRADQEMYKNKEKKKEKAISKSNEDISSIDRTLKY